MRFFGSRIFCICQALRVRLGLLRDFDFIFEFVKMVSMESPSLSIESMKNETPSWTKSVWNETLLVHQVSQLNGQNVKYIIGKF